MALVRADPYFGFVLPLRSALHVSRLLGDRQQGLSGGNGGVSPGAALNCV